MKSRQRAESDHDATYEGGATRVRLQRFLADAGVASRRHAEEMVLDGRITMNDRVVDSLPAFVNPATDRVFADGQRVRPQRLTYMLLHKPKNVVATSRDPEGRRRAVDLLPPMKERLFPVGRLDAESTGALLMTNDGELTQQLTHPSYAIPKVYRAEVDGFVEASDIEQLRKGVYLAEGKARVSEVSIVHAARDRSVLEITLREGPNRQVRRMLARLNHRVRKLKRIMIGPISIKGLPAGACRHLSLKEIEELRVAIEAAKTTAAPRPRKRKRWVARDATPRDARARDGDRPRRAGADRSPQPGGVRPPSRPVGKPQSRPGSEPSQRKRRIIT
ncbi:MAG: rRNA pseudouridine synthase [Phycisphaerales bacterium]|nr:rRNA pseudouridine synthase [Phycisphaerales bacterium]